MTNLQKIARERVLCQNCKHTRGSHSIISGSMCLATNCGCLTFTPPASDSLCLCLHTFDKHDSGWCFTQNCQCQGFNLFATAAKQSARVITKHSPESYQFKGGNCGYVGVVNTKCKCGHEKINHIDSERMCITCSCYKYEKFEEPVPTITTTITAAEAMKEGDVIYIAPGSLNLRDGEKGYVSEPGCVPPRFGNFPDCKLPSDAAKEPKPSQTISGVSGTLQEAVDALNNTGRRLDKVLKILAILYPKGVEHQDFEKFLEHIDYVWALVKEAD